MRAEAFLNESERQAVARAIASAEQRTRAELVCAVATESGRYDRAEGWVGLLAALVLLAPAHLLAAASGGIEGNWGHPYQLGLAGQAAVVTLGYCLGQLLASRWTALRRPFVPRGELAEEVARAAAHVYASARLGATRGETGLLIYVSLFEHAAVVLGDDNIVKAIGQAGLDALRDTGTAALARGERSGALVATVAQAAELLAGPLPADATDNPDELPNRVLLFDPRP